jgi:hypothetical protein
MRRINSNDPALLSALLVTAVLALVAGCSVNVKKEPSGKDQQVDISTPVGGIHVSQEANIADIGLPVYPGAKLKQKDSDGDDKSANVNISGFGFGLKVVALEYASDDPPEKIVAYYQQQLKKYGTILVCHTDHLDVQANIDTDHGSSQQLTCQGSGSNTELKVGTKENQHIVAVKPEGSGSSFSLVYLRTHGKDADI